jgi:hypothetical protein
MFSKKGDFTKKSKLINARTFDGRTARPREPVDDHSKLLSVFGLFNGDV